MHNFEKGIFIVSTIFVFIFSTISIVLADTTIFEKKILYDNDTSTQDDFGWDPNGMKKWFKINDTDVKYNETMVIVNVDHQNPFILCAPNWIANSEFHFACEEPPENGTELHYGLIRNENTTTLK